MSETIESTLTENRVFHPPKNIAEAAAIPSMAHFEALRAAAESDPEGFWAGLAREHLDWHTPFTKTLNDSNPPFYKWFEDGRMNVAYNCVDRHLKSWRKNKAAIIWEGEPGDSRVITYQELYLEVNKLANVMKNDFGIKKGDRVVLYMPMVPEAAVAMLACARIGAIHSVVFGGFSAEALKDRIEDAAAKLVITADGGWRREKIVPLKEATDEALSHGCPSVEHVLVVRRTGQHVHMKAGRDVWWEDCVPDGSYHCDPEPVESEHPLFILYTSGSTGKPKGVVHSSAGYLLWGIMTMKWVFDLKEEDTFWCTADVGWITGHTYVVYGALAAGATTVMYEGAPTTPHAGRLWEICEKHAVNTFYTAPTAIRALVRLGDEWPNKYDLSHLRILGTVGEPINPEAWMWYYRTIGKENCPIVDTYWQTETGGHMIAPLPGATPIKPGSATNPLPGIDAAIVDGEGNPVEKGQGGLLVVRKPWPSMLRTVWGDDQRFVDTYWAKFSTQGKMYYFAGDGARTDEDGYYWIMGRVDDVINVSGHRLGTMEIESALVSHPLVAESAVVGRPDEIKGEGIFAFVILKGGRDEYHRDELVRDLREHVAKEIGALAKPDEIRFADNLPKTRSGKIMRRLLRDIAAGREITSDTSTLEDQKILDQLRGEE